MTGFVLDLGQDGPEFDPSIDEDGNTVHLREPPFPGNPDLDDAEARDAAEIAAIEAEIEAEIELLKQVPLPIDLEDNQRGIRHSDDFTSQLGNNFVPWACAADLGGVLINPTYKYNKNQITCRLRFRYPDSQRGAAILEITAPRDSHASDNPAHQMFHFINIKFPAIKIAKLIYDEIPRDEVSQHFPNFPDPAAPDSTQVGTLEILAGQAIVQGLMVPTLLTPEIQAKVEDIIKRAHTASTDRPLLIRAMIRIGDDTCTKQEVDNFSDSIDREQNSDPIDAWFTGAPRTQVLNVGNITKILKRPDIPLQAAETIYADSKEYQMHHIYAATYENDFIKLAATGFEDVDFFARMISMTSSVFRPDSLPTAYLCFVDLQSFDVEIPEVGNRLKITLALDSPTLQCPDGYVPQLEHDLEPNEDEDQLQRADPGDNDFLEDNIEDQDNYFDDHDDDLATHKNPNLWNGIVIESVLTPPGHVCCLLERRREPNWQGDADDRPFVLTDVPCISDQHTNIRALEKALDAAPRVSVTIKPDFSQQSYKDEIRSCDTLFSSRLDHKIALRNYILCPTMDDELPVDLISQMGDLDTIKDFSPSQQEFYESLRAVKKGISLLNAPFGTGKTTIALAIALKLQSKTLKAQEKKPQIVYTTSTNMSVDDAARRYAKLAAKHGMTHLKIIRAHSPKSEKAKVFHGKGRKSRFLKLDDGLLNEFLATAYVSDLGEDYEAKRKHGDPRRVVEELSLATAMVAFMNDNLHDPAFRTLKSQLGIAAKDGMAGLDLTQIRAQVNTLMARTLRDADAIFCTLNALTKAIMTENLNPVLIINDESCRATELAILAMFAYYMARVYMFLGDPNQLRPVVLSAGREKDFYDLPFLNPFYPSAGKSFLERMMQCGHPVTMLTEQFRCHGGNAYFAIKNFYYNMVKDVNAAKPMLPAVEAMRRYTYDVLKLPKGSNLVLFAVQHSRSFRQTSGTSTENPDHVHAVLELVDDLCDHKEFTSLDQTRPGTITIAPMYRAQASGYNKGLQRSKSIDRSRVKVRTIDGMQGHEDDVVIVDLTRAKGAGFTGQKNRITVACTRAILLLIVVVNPEMLDSMENSAQLESTKHLDRLLSFCQFTKKDCWIIADSYFCKNCKQPGHSSKDCTEPKPCLNCKQTGHEAKECTAPRNMDNVNCRNCHKTGHFARDCKVPKPPFCKRCRVLGHLKQDENCPQRPDLSAVRCNKCGMLGHLSHSCKIKLTLRQLQTARQDQRESSSAHNNNAESLGYNYNADHSQQTPAAPQLLVTNVPDSETKSLWEDTKLLEFEKPALHDSDPWASTEPFEFGKPHIASLDISRAATTTTSVVPIAPSAGIKPDVQWPAFPVPAVSVQGPTLNRDSADDQASAAQVPFANAWDDIQADSQEPSANAWDGFAAVDIEMALAASVNNDEIEKKEAAHIKSALAASMEKEKILKLAMAASVKDEKTRDATLGMRMGFGDKAGRKGH